MLTTIEDAKLDELHAAAEELKKLAGKKGADVEVPNLDDVKAEAPDWYSYTSFTDAAVSFDDREEGVAVLLEDCTMRESTELQRIVKAENTLDTYAAFCKHHIKAVEGKHAPIFNADPPPKGAPMKAWKEWSGNVSEKNLNRLVSGIMMFRQDVGAEGNE